MNKFQRNIYRTVIESITPSPFSIESSVSSQGLGVLEIFNGEPSEVINLSFVMSGTGTFDSLSFTEPITVLVLDTLHKSRNGFMTLDINGNGTSNYVFSPITDDKSCLVTITSRSSGINEGVGYSTNVI